MTHELKQMLLRTLAITVTVGWFGYLFYAYRENNTLAVNKNVSETEHRLFLEGCPLETNGKPVVTNIIDEEQLISNSVFIKQEPFTDDETNNEQASVSTIDDEFAIGKIFNAEKDSKKEISNIDNKTDEEKNKSFFKFTELKKITEEFEENLSNNKITFYC